MSSSQVQAVIFDWAGTTLDYGCFAPTTVFVDGFRGFGVEITLDEARQPMGKFKRDHIADILAMPQVVARWQDAHGRLPDARDLDALYADFVPRQLAVIAAHSDPIPGVIDTVANLRDRGLKIGSCTGYTRAMMDVLVPAARAKGFEPDAVVTPDEVRGGRPAPWMCFENAQRLNVYPMHTLVKVGDTPADVHEGLNAGMWTVGIATTGNEMGLTEAEFSALSPDERTARLAPVYARLFDTGAHYVIDAVADLLPVIDAIAQRLAKGERP